MPKSKTAKKPKRRLRTYIARRHFDACVSFELKAHDYDEACKLAEQMSYDIKDEDILSSIEPGELSVEETT